MKTFISRSIAFCLFVILSACSGDDDPVATEPNPSNKSISELLASEADYSILNEALDRTGLSANLNDTGSFTLFAPNNAAFNALFTAEAYSDLDALIQDIGTGQLRDILSYHLLGESINWASFESGYYQSMTQTNAKDNLSLYLSKSAIVQINSSATVVAANINANNGVVHGVDNVLMPLSVYELLAVHPDYSSLTAAIGLADGDLDSVLSDENKTYTFFAPNNAAFDTIVARTPNVSNLFEYVATLGTDALADLILYHGSSGAYLAADLQTGNLSSLAVDGNGNSLQFFVNLGSTVRLIDNSPFTDDAQVIETDMVGTNGVLHFIDALMLPN
ncbi:MAG: fasciclin domain-containing protein [Bacteroidetes bacterium]|nr:fasciclin domain-containing protein [Bacteroidota bacterium]